MKIEVFVARFRNHYGIGLSPAIAEENVINEAHPRVEAYRDAGSVYPDTKSRGECMDFAQESLENYDKRQAALIEFREKGRMTRAPAGSKFVWVDDMGSMFWEGADPNAVDSEAVDLKFSPDTVPAWQ